jgi:hypothetical protein
MVETIDESSEATIASTSGKIDIKRVNRSSATLKAGTTVHVGEKFNEHATVVVIAQGDVTIDQKIDQHSNANITSVKGSITVGQGMSGNAVATLQALNGSITMDRVDGDCTLSWRAQSFHCPHQDGTINHIP